MGASAGTRTAAAKFRPAVGFWASRYRRASAWIAAALLPAALGCAHAPKPCPTSPARIDEHRAEVERLDAEVGRARREERAAKERREEAARRAAEAQAKLDSLVTAAAPGSSGR